MLLEAWRWREWSPPTAPASLLPAISNEFPNRPAALLSFGSWETFPVARLDNHLPRRRASTLCHSGLSPPFLHRFLAPCMATFSPHSPLQRRAWANIRQRAAPRSPNKPRGRSSSLLSVLPPPALMVFFWDVRRPQDWKIMKARDSEQASKRTRRRPMQKEGARSSAQGSNQRTHIGKRKIYGERRLAL